MKKYKLTFKKSLMDSKPESITVEAVNRFEAYEIAASHVKYNYPDNIIRSVHMNYGSNEITYSLL